MQLNSLEQYAPDLVYSRWPEYPKPSIDPESKTKKRVTFLVGIVSKDGIVVGAESQTTKGSHKQTTTKKVTVLESKSGHVLVAEAGAVSLSNEAVRLFQSKLRIRELNDDDAVSRVAVEAVREVRKQQIALVPRRRHNPRKWQEHFSQEDNYFELMVAYYFGDKPFLFTINPAWCIADRPLSFFHTSGTGQSLGNYLLKEYAHAGMDSDFATVIAIYVVSKVKENDIYCSGRTSVAVLKTMWAGFTKSHKNEAYSDVFTAEQINDIEELLAAVDRKVKRETKSKIVRGLFRNAQKEVERMFSGPASSRYEVIAHS